MASSTVLVSILIGITITNSLPVSEDIPTCHNDIWSSAIDYYNYGMPIPFDFDIDLGKRYLLTGVRVKLVDYTKQSYSWTSSIKLELRNNRTVYNFELAAIETCKKFSVFHLQSRDFTKYYEEVIPDVESTHFFRQPMITECLAFKHNLAPTIGYGPTFTLIGCEERVCKERSVKLSDKSLYPDDLFFSSDTGTLKGSNWPASVRSETDFWVPKIPKDSWIGIHFQSEKVLSGITIISKTRAKSRSHTVYYSLNCMDYKEDKYISKVQPDGTEKITFKVPLRVYCVKVKPTNPTGRHYTMRLDVVGCRTGKVFQQSCGSRSQHHETRVKRVVGGVPFAHGQWPWLVSLVTAHYYACGGAASKSGLPVRSHLCGGSLIDRQWVLTAAHCVEFLLPEPLSDLICAPNDLLALFGESHKDEEHGTEHFAEIEKIIKHPDYIGSAHVTDESEYSLYTPWTTHVENDLALLKLKEPVELTEYVNTVCLPGENDDFMTGENCIASGWGTIFLNDTNQAKAGRYIDVELMDAATCRKRYEQFHQNGENQNGTMEVRLENFSDKIICSRGPGVLQGPCHGDSGGPLVCRRGDKWIHVGIVSWGEVCGSRERPNAYARTQAYLEWINDVMENN